MLVKGLVDELEEHTADYLRKTGTWNEPERQAHQKQVAAKVSKLLETGKPLLETRVEKFDILLEFFRRAQA